MLPRASLETFPNGLKLVLAPDDHVESVSFGLFVASGSRHEKPRFAGISHFIEHMLFKGTPTRGPLEISQTIEGKGGNVNAWTGEEGTCFYATMPCEYLGTAVDVLTDMYLHASIPADEFERERAVVLEEIKMYDDEPDSVAGENLSRALFPKNALGLPIAGSPEKLKALKPADLRAYIRRAYVPRATCAVVAGNFDPALARKLVRARLGRRAGGKPLAAERYRLRTPTVEKISVSREVHQTQIALGFRTPGAHAPLAVRSALTVFDCIMGRGMSSRLFREVREKRGLSYDIRSQAQLFDDTGAWIVSAGVDPKCADKAMKAIEAELARIASKPVPADELRRAKDFISGNFRLAFESVRRRMYYFASCVQTFGRIIPPETVLDSIERVSSADILALAKRVLTPRNRAVSFVVPK